ncbi:hypothetical protein Vi05172_g12952 [Venturia inaequalis]|nr:hypothetical protein Vi05172_g12952 [Venturia inaequalis]
MSAVNFHTHLSYLAVIPASGSPGSFLRPWPKQRETERQHAQNSTIAKHEGIGYYYRTAVEDEAGMK